MGELVEDVENPILPPVVGSVFDEVIGSDMVRPFGAQSHARAVGQPEPAFFRLLGWNFKPLAPPDAFHPLVVDDPTRRASKQLRDLTIAVTAILAGKLDNVGGQPFLVIPPHGDATLRGTVLPENRQMRRSDIAGASTPVCRTILA